MKKLSFLISLLGLGLVSGSAFANSSDILTPSTNPYEMVASEKSLQTSSAFVLIDDFNDGVLKSGNGSDWKKKTSAPSTLKLDLLKEDARHTRGYSLQAQFDLKPDHPVHFKTHFQGMDVSQATDLVFRYQIIPQAHFQGKLKVQLVDAQNQRSEYSQNLSASAKTAWQNSVIPIEAFLGVDLNAIHELRFTLESNTAGAGVFAIDEIAFFGPSNLSFESHRDNLVGFPKKVLESGRQKYLSAMTDDQKFLKTIARDTWKYFTNARDRDSSLIVDHLRLGNSPLAADYTSNTNIAMDLLSIVSARELGFISAQNAEERVRAIFDSLKKLQRHKNFFFNFYNTKNLEVTRSYISSVDSGWLAVALVVMRQAFPGDIAVDATQFLDSFDFAEFLDQENNQLLIGLEIPEKEGPRYHYGMLATEARATSLCAIGKGDIPEEHWWFLFRTPPEAWRWQTQTPQGYSAIVDGVDYFQGYYIYQDKKFVPSWGGSLFEFLMPTLVLDEEKYAPESLGMNNRIVTEIQRDYALKEMNYPIWGFSPAAISNGRNWRYAEFGVKAMGVKGYPDRGVVTPHVSFLALATLPEDAISNIRKMLDYEVYGPYGFYDSIRLSDGQVNTQYLALDQGMILIAICNYLKEGAIQKLYHKDTVGKRVENLLMKESFFKE